MLVEKVPGTFISPVNCAAYKLNIGRKMAFNRDQVADLLAQCHRRCCICHRFCGFKMETDHIKPSGDGGSDDIENAIPVCFECHSEIHCYNNDHPRGRKFTESELREHKNQWLDICKNKPDIFSQPFQSSDAGPLISLIDELEYNLIACNCHGSSLSTTQFEEALRKGAISLLEHKVKNEIYSAYAEVNHINQLFYASINEGLRDRSYGHTTSEIHKNIPKANTAISGALKSLKFYLDKE